MGEAPPLLGLCLERSHDDTQWGRGGRNSRPLTRIWSIVLLVNATSAKSNKQRFFLSQSTVVRGGGGSVRRGTAAGQAGDATGRSATTHRSTQATRGGPRCGCCFKEPRHARRLLHETQHLRVHTATTHHDHSLRRQPSALSGQKTSPPPG